MTRYYWDQCYELGPSIHWALCDDESREDGLVSCAYMVLAAEYETCMDGRPLPEQFMPKKIVDLLNGESDSIKELQSLHDEISDFEDLVAGQDRQLCELRKEIERLREELYEAKTAAHLLKAKLLFCGTPREYHMLPSNKQILERWPWLEENHEPTKP